MEKTKKVVSVNVVDVNSVVASQFYIDVRQGKRSVEYVHPDLAEILSETNGIMIFQEQVMQFFVDIVGYTIEKSDVVRSAIGKKQLDIIQATFKDIREACELRGWTEDQINTVCQQIQAFAKYSFNRCLSGKEIIFRPRCKKGMEKTIEQMYKIKNDPDYATKVGSWDLHKKYNRVGYGKAWSMESDGRLRPNKIIDIRFSGNRETLEIKLESGRSVVCTDNHKFPVGDKEKLAGELVLGDALFVGVKHEKSRGEIAFGKRDDLAATGVSCHKKAHHKTGRIKHGQKGRPTVQEKVVQIKRLGVESTYDVEMAAPYHNFVLNSGIVTCNSHSRAYAELGYVTMYLKRFFPLEWWTAVLNAKLNNDKEDDLRAFISLLGNKITSPTLIYPSKKFFIQGKKIVSPIGAVKGIGKVAIEELCAKGPFKSIEDFVERIDSRSVNSGAFFSAVLAGAADGFMSTDKSYAEAKKELVDKYVELRKKTKKKTEIKDGVLESDPFNIFVSQKMHNMCFNRLLLEDEGVRGAIKKMWPGLKITDDSMIPFVFQGVIVPGSASVAAGLKESKYANPVGMVLLFDESEIKKGISKKSGRPWSLLSIVGNDGFTQVEVSMWDRDRPVKWKEGHPFFVRGRLKDGFKNKICIQAEEIYSLYDAAQPI